MLQKEAVSHERKKEILSKSELVITDYSLWFL